MDTLRKKQVGFRVSLYLIALFLLLVPTAVLAAPAGGQEAPVIWVVVKGEIDQGQTALVKRAAEMAEREQAQGLVIEMDTFGGLVDAAVSIRDLIINEERPTVCFVHNRAWSAGALIAMAHRQIFMAPGSTVGAAEPIPATEKYIAAVKAEFSATAARTGRDPRVAEAMVDKTLGFEPYAKPGQILALTGEQAVKTGYAAAVTADRNEVAAKMGWQNAPVREVALSMTDRGVAMMAEPAVKSIFVALIVLALLSEIKMGGSGIGAGIAVIGAALFFGGQWLSGLTGWLEMALFFSGMLLLGIEALVPGFGIFGVSGILCMLASLFFVLGGDAPAVKWLAFSVGLALALFLLILRYLPSSSLWGRFVLKDVEGRKEGFRSGANHQELLGKTGVVVTKLRPAGVIVLDESKYDVVSEGEFVEVGTAVLVVKVEGARIVVRAASAATVQKEEE